MPYRNIENWFALMCSALRQGDLSEEIFVEDSRRMGIPVERIEAFIENLKKEDGIENGSS